MNPKVHAIEVMPTSQGFVTRGSELPHTMACHSNRKYCAVETNSVVSLQNAIASIKPLAKDKVDQLILKSQVSWEPAIGCNGLNGAHSVEEPQCHQDSHAQGSINRPKAFF